MARDRSYLVITPPRVNYYWGKCSITVINWHNGGPHYISHTIYTTEIPFRPMDPYDTNENVSVCVMYCWMFLSIHWWNRLIIPYPYHFIGNICHTQYKEIGDCEFYCWIIEIINNVMNAGRKFVFSLRKPAPLTVPIKRVIAEPVYCKMPSQVRRMHLEDKV